MATKHPEEPIAECGVSRWGVSPKRYLWSREPTKQPWRLNYHGLGGDNEPFAAQGPFAVLVNDLGEPLHRLADEGLIEPLRTEQDGQLPARTVYGITDEGRRELHALRAEALQEIKLHPDPVDLALAMSHDQPQEALRGYFEDRVHALATHASQLEHQRARKRLAHLKLEFKAHEKTPEKAMGVYEQNIGLKSNRSY